MWNVLRICVFTGGVTALAWSLTAPAAPERLAQRARLALVALIPLVLVTVPGFAVDLTRFETQEPLVVGATAAGAVLLATTTWSVLHQRARRQAWVTGVLGIVLWTLGVLQKETSLAILLVAPFLLPFAPEANRLWRELGRRGRLSLIALATAATLPLLLMTVWTAKIIAAGELVYGVDVKAGPGLIRNIHTQVVLAGPVLGTSLGTVLCVATVIAVIAVLVRCRSLDWLALGLLVVAAGFLVFAAESGVVTSRYYLPSLALLALALARLVSRLGANAMYVVVAMLAIFTLTQFHDARSSVRNWAGDDRLREAIVRDAAARSAGGCQVTATGTTAEFLFAFPVLLPLAREKAAGCEPGRRYVVVFGGATTGPDAEKDPILAACLPATEVKAFGKPTPTSDAVATVLRCAS